MKIKSKSALLEDGREFVKRTAVADNTFNSEKCPLQRGEYLYGKKEKTAVKNRTKVWLAKGKYFKYIEVCDNKGRRGKRWMWALYDENYRKVMGGTVNGHRAKCHQDVVDLIDIGIGFTSDAVVLDHESFKAAVDKAYVGGRIYAANIEWDTDGEYVCLPDDVFVPDSILRKYDIAEADLDAAMSEGLFDDVEDMLSNRFGWCHFGPETIEKAFDTALEKAGYDVSRVY